MASQNGLRTWRNDLRTWRNGLTAWRNGLRTWRNGLRTCRNRSATWRNGLRTWRNGSATSINRSLTAFCCRFCRFDHCPPRIKRKRPPFQTASFLRPNRELQVIYDKVRHHLVPVADLGSVGDAVALAGVEHQIELLVVFLQFVDELNGVLHMDVVVHDAVDQ